MAPRIFVSRLTAEPGDGTMANASVYIAKGFSWSRKSSMSTLSTCSATEHSVSQKEDLDLSDPVWGSVDMLDVLKTLTDDMSIGSGSVHRLKGGMDSPITVNQQGVALLAGAANGHDAAVASALCGGGPQKETELGGFEVIASKDGYNIVDATTTPFKVVTTANNGNAVGSVAEIVEKKPEPSVGPGARCGGVGIENNAGAPSPFVAVVGNNAGNGASVSAGLVNSGKQRCVAEPRAATASGLPVAVGQCGNSFVEPTKVGALAVATFQAANCNDNGTAALGGIGASIEHGNQQNLVQAAGTNESTFQFKLEPAGVQPTTPLLLQLARNTTVDFNVIQKHSGGKKFTVEEKVQMINTLKWSSKEYLVETTINTLLNYVGNTTYGLEFHTLRNVFKAAEQEVTSAKSSVRRGISTVCNSVRMLLHKHEGIALDRDEMGNFNAKAFCAIITVLNIIKNDVFRDPDCALVYRAPSAVPPSKVVVDLTTGNSGNNSCPDVATKDVTTNDGGNSSCFGTATNDAARDDGSVATNFDMTSIWKGDDANETDVILRAIFDEDKNDNTDFLRRDQ